MEKFARLLQTEQGQVLFLIDWDVDEGGYALRTIVEMNGTRATTTVWFAARADALEKMDSFDEQQAARIYQVITQPSLGLIDAKTLFN